MKRRFGKNFLFSLFLLFFLLPGACPLWADYALADDEAGKSEAKEESVAKLSKEAENGMKENAESGSVSLPAEPGETVDQPSYPGVTNRVMEAEADYPANVRLFYPEFGNALVDKDIKEWIEERRKYYDSLLPEKNSESGEDEELSGNWEMTGFYTLERPKSDIASILFNIYAYTGGAHGNVWLSALNYDLASGKQLHFDDLFEDGAAALHILSRLSIEQLAKSLGEDTDPEWLERGAGPETENFSELTLVPDGLFVEFQPYQVGPWAVGPQRVFVSLKDLLEAGPSSNVWNLPVPEIAPKEHEADKESAVDKETEPDDLKSE